MKKTLYCLLVIAFIFATCSKSNINKAKELIEIGDYTQAVSNLNIEIEKNPKNIDARELLVKCYDYKKEWNNAIEQLLILKKINPQRIYDMSLFKFYALNNQFIKVKELFNKYSEYKNAFKLLDNIDNKYSKKRKNKILFLADSLGIPSDSVYTIRDLIWHELKILNPKIRILINDYEEKWEIEKKNEKIQFTDSLKLNNLFFAFFLWEIEEELELIDYDYYLFCNYYKSLDFILELDSCYYEYIRYAIQKNSKGE